MCCADSETHHGSEYLELCSSMAEDIAPCITLCCIVQGAEKVKAAQQEAEALKRETALSAAALEGRTQALGRQEAAAAEAKALLAVRTKELDNREASHPLLAFFSSTSVARPTSDFTPASGMLTQHALIQAMHAFS